MIIFLLSFLLADCYGAYEFLAFKKPEDNESVYFWRKQTAQDAKEEFEKSGIKEIQDHLIPVGKYSCEFSESGKTVGQDQVASLLFHDKKKAMAGHLVLSYDNRNDDKKIFDGNFISILNNKNFANPDESTITLSQSFRNKLDFITLLNSCFNQNHVQITLANEWTFSANEWNQKASIFDAGIALHVDEFLYKNAVGCSRNHSQVSIQTFISAIKKYSYSDLAWFEKILMWFDPKYFYTKGFFKGDAPYMTFRHSKSFRHNFLRYVGIPLVIMIVGLKVYRAYRGK
jgi:hypothetical protein